MLSEADKMFEDLGYKKTENTLEIRYSYIDKREEYNNQDIIFYKAYKSLETYLPECREDYESDSGVLSKEELQAVYRKLRELSWI